MPRTSYDVAIVGATHAGRAVAAAARRHGARVVMVDHDPRLRAHESHWSVLRSRLVMAWTALQPLTRATDLTRATANRIFENEAKVGHSLPIEESSDPGVVLLQGPVELRSGHEIILADRRVVRAESIVLAPPSRPRRPGRFFRPDLPVDDPVAFLGNGTRPRSAVIVGADWSGCEWAFALACLGCSVLLIDRRSRLLRSLDAEFRLCVQEHLHQMGVEDVLARDAPPGFASERFWQVCADLERKIGRPDPGLAIGRLTAGPSE